MTTKLSGILTDKFPPETITATFSKRVFWLVQGGAERYPQHWQVELYNEDMKRLDEYSIGDLLEAEVEVRGKKWTKGIQANIILSLKCIGLRRLDNLPHPPTRKGPPRKDEGFRFPEIFD